MPAAPENYLMSRPHTGFRLWAIGAVSALAVFSASAANAVSLPVNPPGSSDNSDWTAFYFAGADALAFDKAEYYSNSTVDTNFTFTIAGPAYLNVTDGFLPGDEFSVAEVTGPNPGTLGQTSTVATPGCAPNCNDPNILNNWEGAFGSTTYSWAQFLLGPGTYSIEISAIDSPWSVNGLNQGALEVVAATPLPSSWTLMLAGLIGLGYVAYRGSAKSVAPIATV